MKGINRYGEPDSYDAWLDRQLDEHHESERERDEVEPEPPEDFEEEDRCPER